MVAAGIMALLLLASGVTGMVSNAGDTVITVQHPFWAYFEEQIPKEFPGRSYIVGQVDVDSEEDLFRLLTKACEREANFEFRSHSSFAVLRRWLYDLRWKSIAGETIEPDLAYWTGIRCRCHTGAETKCSCEVRYLLSGEQMKKIDSEARRMAEGMKSLDDLFDLILSVPVAVSGEDNYVAYTELNLPGSVCYPRARFFTRVVNHYCRLKGLDRSKCHATAVMGYLLHGDHSERHSWVRVRYKGRTYFVDPMNLAMFPELFMVDAETMKTAGYITGQEAYDLCVKEGLPEKYCLLFQVADKIVDER